jgi:thiol-disulfide isomerase/thioredoxin
MSIVSHAQMVHSNDARTIMMFGARWCAPCMEEYRQLPDLARASAPDRIMLAWIDKQIAPPTPGIGTVETLPADEARRLARSVLGEGYGLPFSVMFDKSGRRCTIWRSPLRIRDIGVMQRQCGG